jgi:GntR family transcriptional regulator/MocR family aminotransferase
VIYVGSFSKSALPSLRLGYVVAPASLTHAVRAAKYLCDWHTVWAVQGALADFIEEGWYARHLRKTRVEYQGRHAALASGLETHFKDLFTVVPSSVGLHICAVANDLSPSDIQEAVARATDVGVDDLMRYSADRPTPGLLFGYGAISVGRIEEGLVRLRRRFTESAH